MKDVNYKIATSNIIEDDMRDFPFLLHVNKQVEIINNIIKREK